MKYNPKSIEDVIKSSTTENTTKCFYELFGDDYIYCNKQIYYYNGTNWEISNTAIRRKFTKEFTSVFIDYNISVMNSMKSAEPESDEYKALSDKTSKVSALIKLLQSNRFIKDCCNDSIIPYIENNNIKFELNPFIFCFNNAVYDLEKMEFVEVPNREDYMTLTTGYDYREPTEEEIDELTLTFGKVFPDEKERILYMIILATGLFGKTLENFILANGTGRNGKGSTNELALKMFGNYGYTCSNAVLLNPIKDGPNQALANMDHKRAIFYREPNTDAYSQLNSSTIKEITGGNEVNARGLHSTNTRTNLKGTHILECNQKPKMSGETDDAIMMRLIDMGFISTFTKSEEDVSEENHIYIGNDSVKLTSYQEKHKFALFHILLEHWKLYQAKDYNLNPFIPDSIKKRGSEYLKDSNEIFSWLSNEYEKTDDDTDVIQLKDVFEEFKRSDTYSNFNKKEKRELSQKVFYEKIQKNPFLKKYYRDRDRRKEIKEKYSITEMRNILTNFKKTKKSMTQDDIDTEDEESECT